MRHFVPQIRYSRTNIGESFPGPATNHPRHVPHRNVGRIHFSSRKCGTSGRRSPLQGHRQSPQCAFSLTTTPRESLTDHGVFFVCHPVFRRSDSLPHGSLGRRARKCPAPSSMFQQLFLGLRSRSLAFSCRV